MLKHILATIILFYSSIASAESISITTGLGYPEGIHISGDYKPDEEFFSIGITAGTMVLFYHDIAMQTRVYPIWVVHHYVNPFLEINSHILIGASSDLLLGGRLGVEFQNNHHFISRISIGVLAGKRHNDYTQLYTMPSFNISTGYRF